MTGPEQTASRGTPGNRQGITVAAGRLCIKYAHTSLVLNLFNDTMKQIAHTRRTATCCTPRLPLRGCNSRQLRLKVSAVLQEDPPHVSSAKSSESHTSEQQLALVEQQLNRLLAPSLAGQERPPPQELQTAPGQVTAISVTLQFRRISML